MKTTLFLLALFLCLSIPTYTQRTFSVTGTGEIKLEPDEAVISIGVSLRDPDLEKVSQEIEKRAAAIIAILKEKEVLSKNIQSSFATLSPVYISSVNDTVETTPDYYNAEKGMNFVLKNLSHYDEIMLSLYKAGLNRIDSVIFRVSNMEKHKSKVRQLAIKNAKEIANSLAEGFGARTGRIYTMSERFADYKPPSPIYDFNSYIAKSYQTSAMESLEGPSISGGEVVITSTVSATFYINKPKK